MIPSVHLLIVIIPIVVLLNAVMLNVVILDAIMLSVVAPINYCTHGQAQTWELCSRQRLD